MITVIEKVIFLRDIDIFRQTTTEDLSHLAQISDEVEFSKGETIYEEGEFPDSLYLVLDGEVCLKRSGRVITSVERNEVIGSWALFDDEPREMTATASRESRLLRIDKGDFYDVLADHAQITESIFKALSRKAKMLMSRVNR